jgi:hypothetical protein
VDSARMTTSSRELRDALEIALADGEWTELQEIYRRVAGMLTFDMGDLLPEVTGSKQRAWQRNIRNVLGRSTKSGEILRHKHAPAYRLQRPKAPRRTVDGAVATQGAQRPARNSAPLDVRESALPEGSASPRRIPTVVHRVERDSQLVATLKRLHAYACQICDARIPLGGNRYYAEVHHLQPLGTPHNGPDAPENMIVVCANCHAQLDLGVRKLDARSLEAAGGHEIGLQYVEYHNRLAAERGAT